MENKTVSIVMCTYNGERFLREQLDSILSQTYPLLEVIIQDDHSTDGTMDILNRYAREHEVVKVFTNDGERGVNRDSPVTYPEVQNYKQWHLFNGKLLLVSGERVVPQVGKDGKEVKQPKKKDIIDTLEFISLSEDSLILTKGGVRYGFHRKANAREANAAASAAAQKLDSMKMKKASKE